MFSKIYRSLVGKLSSKKDQADSFLLFEKEQPFNSLYNKGMALSKTPDSGVKRRARFYNLISLLKQTADLDGGVVECGCWKGLSSYLMSTYIRDTNTEFKGEHYHIFDSFEGLSQPTSEDVIDYKLVDKQGDRKGSFFKGAGAYNANLLDVKNVLKDFPDITFYQGWIPQVLPQFASEKLKFVHIDLDLYEPIIGALEFFYPMLVRGGIVVCDDYGSLYWPGAKKAVEEFAEKHAIKFISLSTGQAVFIKE
jgi:hypothetical protein